MDWILRFIKSYLYFFTTKVGQLMTGLTCHGFRVLGGPLGVTDLLRVQNDKTGDLCMNII